MADYVNRAVYIPKGTHSVEFTYKPAAFRKGLLISLVSALVFIAIGFLMKAIGKRGGVSPE
jgi:uncharacterized membrane protein YfhO